VDPAALAARDRVDPAALVGRARAGLVSLVGLAARDLVGLEDMNLVGLEGTNLVDLEGMNRVAPGVLEGMDRAVRASLGVLADLATLAVRGLVDPEDMNREDLAERDQKVRDQKVRDPQDLEARALNQGQVQVDPMRMVLDRAQPGLTPADLDRMPAHLDRMPAHLDRTRPAEPTRRVEVTRPAATRLAATRLAAAILPAERALTGSAGMVLASRSRRASAAAHITD
jgi:hypothetical protein